MDRQFDFLIYQAADEDVSVNALIHNDSIWLTQMAMGELFGVSKSTISRHLKNIFLEGELNQEVVVAKIATTSPHGAIPGKTQDKESMFRLQRIIWMRSRSAGWNVRSQDILIISRI